MEETEYALNESVQLMMSADGAAEHIFAPGNAHERWLIERYTTFCQNAGCSLVIYKNFVSDMTVEDSTLSAHDDTGTVEIPVANNERVIFRWENGVPDEMISGQIKGIRFVKGNRAYGR